MKELEDYVWFPPFLRNFQTDFIGFVVAKFNVYSAFILHLEDLSLPVKPMIDLCSGSGEPAISIFKKSKCFSNLTLTDKYPNAIFIQNEKITYEKKSIDILEMKFELEKQYTMFNAFHHFSDEQKLEIIQKIHNSDSSAFIVEILEPNAYFLLKIIFATTIGTLLFTPFISPFSLKRLFFTYIIPINIFTITYDGVVSVLKSRSMKKYKSLFEKFAGDVEVCRLASGLSPLILIHVKAKK